MTDELTGRAAAEFRRERDRAKPTPGARPNGEGEKPPRFPLVRFGDVLMTTTSFYLVKDLIPRAGLVVVYGAPKCGKSFWCFDLLMHVACGWDYRGLRVNGGPIVYCALEGVEGFKRRVEAFRRAYPDAKGAPFYLMFAPLDLIRDHKALIASIRAQLGGVDPAAVAIDTLNRSLIGSESKDEDMAAYVRAADAIRAFSCAVPIIHHCGHSAERPRGHSSLLGAADVLIAVKRDDADYVVATVETSKDGPLGLELVSRLVVVDLEADDEGEMMTSCVIEPVGDAARTASTKLKRQPKLTNSAKTALRALHVAVGELGEVPPSSHVPEGQRAVTVKQWREHAFKIGISGSDDPHAKGVAFNRAFEALVAAQRVGVWDSYAWPVFRSEEGK